MQRSPHYSALLFGDKLEERSDYSVKLLKLRLFLRLITVISRRSCNVLFAVTHYRGWNTSNR